MKIISYRDLESKDDLLPLMDHAFRWTFNPKTYDQFVEIDPRLKNSPVGFCAVENDRVVGFVGVMDLTTRTLSGDLEHVGGIYGVATLPSHVKKGISTALMNKTHEHFVSKGYLFSLLGTSRILIAHSFYEKLGYTDFFEISTAHKVMRKEKAKQVPKDDSSRLDFDKILKVYNAHMEGKAGFTVRDRPYMMMLKKSERLTNKQCEISEEGYVLFRTEIHGAWVNGIWIRELVALNAKEMNRLIGSVERKANDLVYDRAVLDSKLIQEYESCGYMIQNRSHSVMMVKPLTANMSFSQIYGDKFHLTGLDFF